MQAGKRVPATTPAPPSCAESQPLLQTPPCGMPRWPPPPCSIAGGLLEPAGWTCNGALDARTARPMNTPPWRACSHYRYGTHVLHACSHHKHGAWQAACGALCSSRYEVRGGRLCGAGCSLLGFGFELLEPRGHKGAVEPQLARQLLHLRAARRAQRRKAQTPLVHCRSGALAARGGVLVTLHASGLQPSRPRRPSAT